MGEEEKLTLCKLDKEEEEILSSFENNEWKSVRVIEKKKMKDYLLLLSISLFYNILLNKKLVFSRI